METDSELLSQYAENRSEAAFAELVRRHVNLVYSAACREMCGDDSLAQDVTQLVFIELARKAERLIRHPALAGWLYTSVRCVSANFRRSERRRLTGIGVVQLQITIGVKQLREDQKSVAASFVVKNSPVFLAPLWW
jgi:DNA-directed RNA polymerase specialized sigma24 family protein